MNVKTILTIAAAFAATAMARPKECHTVVSTPAPIFTESPVLTPAPVPTVTPAPVPSLAPVTTSPPTTITPPVVDDGAAVAVTAASTGATAKVMSFNVRTSQAPDACPAGCWDQRKARAEAMVQRHQPDFIGTQETTPNQYEFFKQSLGYASFGECAGPCDSSERNSIFYRDADWTLLGGSTFALSDTPEQIPSNTWNLEYLRAAVLARFQNRATGNTVCMLNTHYDITRGQEQSSVLVADRMAAFCQPQDTVVMTGDLNAPPETPQIKYLTGEANINYKKTSIPMYETLTASGEGGPTWIGDFTTQTRGNKIDYIFARRDTHTCLQRGQIIVDDIGGFTSSDHAVLMSTFCLGSGCSQCL